jgi:DNA helicase II / ATP-dependent DNA helicase PcrA
VGHGRVTDALREPGFLTAHQFRVVEADGNLFLVACPGSGKTRAGGVRVARLMSDGKRVAATSYTNVGVEQIRAVVSGDLGIAIASSSFVGTLHGLLLRYVFYPFGHSVMGCAQRPRVFQDDSKAWPEVIFGDNRFRERVTRFTFRPDGSVRYRGSLPLGVGSREEAERLGAEQALGMKRHAAANGLVSADDAMFWSMRVLLEHPDVAAAVARRFDELQIDEAQDTSELQLACVAAMCETGKLDSLVLIGDLEQSIYSFQGASLEGCEALADARHLERMELTENHRSSQRICDVVVHFCGRDAPDQAVGASAECPWEPELMLYPADHPSEVLAWFENRLRELGIDSDQGAVLARANEWVDVINSAARVDLDRHVDALGQVATIVRTGGTLTKRRAEAVDRLLGTVAWDIDDLADLDADQRRQLRDASARMIMALPVLEGDLADWTRGAAQVVGASSRELKAEPARHAGHLIRAKATYAGVSAADAFRRSHTTLRAQTVHDLKGESRDAVLLVAGRAAGGRHTPQGVLWSMPLTGNAVPADEVEELRIAYVALTRAARFCAVALPDNTAPETVQAFIDKGFLHANPQEPVEAAVATESQPSG